MDPPGYDDAKGYLEKRVKQYQSWYDGKAVVAKRRYLRMRILAVVGGALVPVLTNISFDITVYGYPLMNFLVTVTSLLVLVSISLESVLHYRDQWKHYRSTEQFLGHETVRFQTKTGPYQQTRESDAFRLLVERVEGAIAAENAATLNVMTIAAGESRNNT